MKKVFTFIVGMAAAMSSVTAVAEKTVVSTKNEFTAAIAKNREADGVDTIIVRLANGAVINTGGIKSDAGVTCEKGTLYIIGENDELGSRPILQTDWQFGDNTEADNFNLIIENMNLQYRSGAAATSGQIFYCNKKQVFFNQFILRNCEITNYARTIIRTVPTDADATTGEIKYGNFAHFEISDCDIHYSNLTSGNTWACIVMGSPLTECVLKGNIFYDLPYNKQIFSMSYINKDWANVENTEFTIENNAFFTATQQTNPLFDFGSSLGEMAIFSFKNNIFMRPTWENDYNLARPTATDEEGNAKMLQGSIIRLSKGMPVITNNIVSDFYRESTQGWANDQMFDEDGEGAWLCAETDTVAPISPAAAELSWNDYVAPEAGTFLIFKGHPIYAMGTDGAPIGPERCFTDNKIEKVTLTVSVEGSKSAEVVYSPKKDQYLSGDVVRLTVNTKGDLNEFLGWSDGSMETERELTLTEDVTLTATFKEVEYIAVWNLDQLTGNNASFAAPLAANYAAQDDTYFLNYRTFDGTAYVDSLEKAIQTRNNKVSGDVIRNCFILRSTINQLDTLKLPDYVYVEVPAFASAKTVSCYIGTDNYCTKTVNVDYSLDGATWTNFNKTDIAEAGKWTKLEASVPAELEGQKYYVRLQGDANGERCMNPELEELMEIGEANLSFEFLFVADLRILGTATNGIDAIESDNAAALRNGVIYDIMGRKVVNVEAGHLYIQNGKKFIQK